MAEQTLYTWRVDAGGGDRRPAWLGWEGDPEAGRRRFVEKYHAEPAQVKPGGGVPWLIGPVPAEEVTG